ncbi:MAG: hypothetical protein KGI37_07835 [Alphaproteobacteria bacterium]|nr:hypothetical protein [Alphaproteobacteria bacterium]
MMKMLHVLGVAVLFGLCACAAPQPVLKPMEVDVPVSVPCKVTAPQRPDFALAHATPAQTIFEKVRAALVELDQRKAYEAQLESKITACN